MSFRYVIETENPIVTDGNKMFNCNDGKLRLRIVEDNPWHTGTPTEEGWYLIAFNYEFEEGVRYTTDYFKDGKWAFPMVRNISMLKAWQKIEPYKEW